MVSDHQILLLVGKVLFSLIFIITTVMEIMKFGSLVSIARSKNAPVPEVGLPVWMIVKIFYAYALFSGFQFQLATYAVIAALFPVTIFMHDFWKLKNPMEMFPQLIFFLRNISIAGSLLIILALQRG